ncbi:MAG: TRAP transporter small permease [Deltaproteobacteria bacterium]|nr:TRAP transporter small permease [Deltaproteobacteria bacterium]
MATPSAPTPLVDTLSEAYRKFCVVMAFISGLTIAVMMLSTTVDASARYFFNAPLAGIFELNEVILVICVYMGLAWTQIERGHIRVTALAGRVPARARCYMNMVAWSVSFLFVFLVGYQSCLGAIESIRLWEFRWGSVQMPIWWAKSLVPIGCWMLNIQLIIDIWKDIERLRGRLPMEAVD